MNAMPKVKHYMGRRRFDARLQQSYVVTCCARAHLSDECGEDWDEHEVETASEGTTSIHAEGGRSWISINAYNRHPGEAEPCVLYRQSDHAKFSSFFRDMWTFAAIF